LYQKGEAQDSLIDFFKGFLASSIASRQCLNYQKRAGVNDEAKGTSKGINVKMPQYSEWSLGEVLISLSQAIEPVGGYTTESVTHGQCDARPTVTFPANGRYQFILLGEDRHITCVQLARYVKRSGRGSNLRPVGCKSDVLTTTPPRHTKGLGLVYCSSSLVGMGKHAAMV